MLDPLATILTLAALSLLIPSTIVLYRHPEWRQGEDN